MNAIIYRRVSTDCQQGSQLTQDSQTADFCTREGWPVVAEFSDPDTSGTLPIRKRKGGAALVKFLESQAGQPLALVAMNQSRVGRNAYDQIGFILEVWRMGILPCLVEEGGKLPQTIDNELKWNLKAVIAQDEANRIKSRVLSGLRGKRIRNELCGTVPYGKTAIATGEVRRNRSGHEIHVHRLQDNPVELAWLKQIWLWRQDGWAYNKIAKELNRLCVPTKEVGRVHVFKHQGAQIARAGWQCGNVHCVLKNSYTKALIEQWKLPDASQPD